MRHKSHKMSAVLGALAATLFLSCTSNPPGPAGSPQEPMVHHNWWNFYERGCERVRAGDYCGAGGDFETSLGLRSGAKFGFPEERWRARTYGLHFIEGYFPHRELGVCELQMGRTDEAIKLLETSLAMEPSGRAKYYLNRARARKVTGAGLPKPEIQIALGDNVLTNGRILRVAGSVRGPGFVREIAVNDRRQLIELAEPDVPFAETIRLKEGGNRIAIGATDLAGNTASKFLMVTADWRPPEIALRTVSREHGSVSLSGVCHDNLELVSVTANGRELMPGRSSTQKQSFDFHVTFDEDKPMCIEARDAAGNRLNSVLNRDTLAQLAGGFLQNVLASAEGGTADAGGQRLPEKTTDRMKPSLELPAGGKAATIIDEEYFLDGHASDGGGIAAVTVNGEPLLPDAQRGVLQAHFARRLPVDVGTNVFEVAVADLAGNQNVKTVTVIRRIPEYLDDEYRLRICFTPAANCENEMRTLVIKRQTEEELSRDPIRFRLLERNDEAWELISREHELSLSPLADPAAALRIGKMLPAEMVLMTAFFNRGDGVELYAGIRETANGATVWSGDVYSPADDEAFGRAIGDLVMKIKQSFPLVEGRVTAVGGAVTIDVGADQGVRAGTRFLVMPSADGAAGEPGALLRVGDVPAELEITRVKQGSGTGRILPSPATTMVKAGDTVYAR